MNVRELVAGLISVIDEWGPADLPVMGVMGTWAESQSIDPDPIILGWLLRALQVQLEEMVDPYEINTVVIGMYNLLADPEEYLEMKEGPLT